MTEMILLTMIVGPLLDRERSLAAIQKMADSLRELGQLQPIRVRRLPDGKFRVIEGMTRVMAARFIGLSELMAVIVTDDISEDDEIAQTIVANDVRHDFKRIERASNYALLLNKYGWTQAKLAKHLGISTSTLNKVLAIDRSLIAELKAKVTEGAMAFTNGYTISRLDAAKQREYIDTAPKMTREQIEELVARLLCNRPPKPKPTPITVDGHTFVIPAGVPNEVIERFVAMVKKYLKDGKWPEGTGGK